MKGQQPGPRSLAGRIRPILAELSGEGLTPKRRKVLEDRLEVLKAERHKLLTENFGLLGFAVRKLTQQRLESLGGFEEAFQIGFFPFVKAVEMFDPDRGYALSTYIMKVVVFHLARDSQPDRLIRIPRSSMQKFDFDRSRMPEIERGGVIEAEDTRENEHLRLLEIEEGMAKVRKVWWKLSKIQKFAIRARFLQGRSLDDCAKERGVTKEAIRIVQNTAIRKLKRLLAKEEED